MLTLSVMRVRLLTTFLYLQCLSNMCSKPFKITFLNATGSSCTDGYACFLSVIYFYEDVCMIIIIQLIDKLSSCLSSSHMDLFH